MMAGHFVVTERHSEMCDSAQSYWVVIPAYNEAPTVRDVALRARRQGRHVVVVDDGSTDGTAEAVADLDVALLKNEKNLGKAGSLCRGFELALAGGAAGVITLDADGQHAPEEIPLLIERARAEPGALLIGARRRDQRKLSVWRYAANRIADFWIGWAAGAPIEDSQSGFRLYPATLLRAIDVPHERARSFVFESEILIEAARRAMAIRAVSITVASRSGPRLSHFRPVLDIVRITRMVAWKILSRGLPLSGLWCVLPGAVSA
ncbi:MAG: Glycosyl transferase family 2 [Nitrospira sp.]|nr:MAG: Glycosyl transferase family 2 [Nitrospira sp.]